MQEQWETAVVNMSPAETNSAQKIAHRCDAMGLEGWELKAAYYSPLTYTGLFIFQRKIPSASVNTMPAHI